MAKKRRQEAPKTGQRVLVMKNGREYVITGEDAKYIYAEGLQFRHANPAIAEIRERETAAREYIPETETVEGRDDNLNDIEAEAFMSTEDSLNSVEADE